MWPWVLKCRAVGTAGSIPSLAQGWWSALAAGKAGSWREAGTWSGSTWTSSQKKDCKATGSLLMMCLQHQLVNNVIGLSTLIGRSREEGIWQGHHQPLWGQGKPKWPWSPRRGGTAQHSFCFPTLPSCIGRWSPCRPWPWALERLPWSWWTCTEWNMGFRNQGCRRERSVF